MEALLQRDPELARLVQAEQRRQADTLELIASENHASRAVLQAAGTVLTDKYAEGYPGRRYYRGCAHVDHIEQLAIDRAKQLFGAEYANVQPHSGTNANLAVYLAALEPGDTLMAMRLTDGGHLSHGRKNNLSGILYEVVHYGVRRDTEVIDMDEVRDIARAARPRMIVVGASAYPRAIDFQAFGEIAAEVGAYVLADTAHIAGLIVAGVHPDPVPHSTFVTATTHKTLRGPRGGLILAGAEWEKPIGSAVIPGLQGGPLLHLIAAKAVAFREAMEPAFKDYGRRIVANAKALADSLAGRGWRLVSGGTDNHLMLVDLRSHRPDLTGHQAAGWLESANIIANRNTVPFDTRSSQACSGVRFGTPALTTRGMGVEQMAQIGGWIDAVLLCGGAEAVLAEVRGGVAELCRQFPIPNGGEA